MGVGGDFNLNQRTLAFKAEGRASSCYPISAEKGRFVVSRIALKYLLVTAFVSGVVAVIWSGHVSDHIKHVDYVPPPITAPAR